MVVLAYLPLDVCSLEGKEARLYKRKASLTCNAPFGKNYEVVTIAG